MKQSTMRLRSVTLKREWVRAARPEQIEEEEWRIIEGGMQFAGIGKLGFVYLPNDPLSPILPTSGPE